MERRNRRSIRLSSYDYGWPGAYFLTIVTFRRAFLLETDAAQEVVQAVWEELPGRYPDMALDAFVVMPNHIHGVVVVRQDASIVGVIHKSPVPATRRERRSMLLGKAVGYFKMQSAKRLNVLWGTPGMPVWQKNYYEHVVRDEEDLARIRQYIEENPWKWAEDELNPGRAGGMGNS